VFYVAGLPVMALVSVFRRSPSIEFIAAGYRTDGGRIILGWEVLEMARKFLLTSAIIFWPKGTCIQVAVAVIVSIFFLTLHMYYMPYDTHTDNWLQVSALVGLLLFYFMGLLIKVQPQLEERYGFDVLLQIVSIAVATIAVGVPIIHKFRLYLRVRGAKARSHSSVELSESLLANDSESDRGSSIPSIADDPNANSTTSRGNTNTGIDVERRLQAQLQAEQQKLRDVQEQFRLERVAMREQLAREQEGRAAAQGQLRQVQGQLRVQEQERARSSC
jgi:hypothetical protein